MLIAPRWSSLIVGALGVGVAGLVIAAGALPDGLRAEAAWVLGCTWLMAWWWIGSRLPPAVPSLVPLALFPVLGIAPAKEVAPLYADPIVMLLLCGFLAAAAIERWDLHRRLSLLALLRFGRSPRALIGTVMAMTAVISMWISNTATTLMMLPIVAALATATALANRDADANRRYSAALVLAVPWSASIGGMATPIGTPPNLIFRKAWTLATGLEPPSFLAWMIVATPIAAVMLIGAWLLLVRGHLRVPDEHRLGAKEDLRAELASLGPTTRPEILVGLGFVLMAAGWILREPLGVPKAIDDSTIAAGTALAFFLLPSLAGPERPPTLLDWKYASSKVPWGLLLLFGGGLGLSRGFESSGLTPYLGGQLAFLAGLPDGLIVVLICLAVTFLTEVTSNTATTSLLLPVLAGVAAGTGADPLLLMVSATLSASCAFMLPVGTAPNAIAIGSGLLDADDMFRLGLRLNFVGVVVITGAVLLGQGVLRA